ncbi:MAG: UDP-N-acetylmuramate--L-alanine ligase [Armatimonadetes bacterium JP3_11]|nr:MAG: UDP-N-acetylmuramate--L-alanine ligase [Armatimonadetes bacterium CP1_7O]OYT74949.1 MAG: UDP-N-acetylmuramate--L-alanine ligase [Armatimonadetes bacterium JP3_11]RMH06880.1 MAG: UDP-N-acetylmuramate--L-alanine ligase [Armatimonadota bacterium]
MYTPTGVRLTTHRAPELTMRFHFVGIGGAGMSALARWLRQKGVAVSGSDLVESPTLNALRALGVDAYAPHDAQRMGHPDWLIVSDAIHPDNPEVIEAQRREIPIWRRSQLLGWLLRDYKVIAIAGTHGKSTTTAMTAAILEAAGYDPVVFIGADVPLPEPWQGNVRLGHGDWAVVEACEAYESFLDLQPHIALITNIEADHLDYHGSLEQLLKSFVRFAKRVPPDGYLVACGDSPGVREMMQMLHSAGGHERPPILYGLGAQNDLEAEIRERTPTYTEFRVHSSHWNLPTEPIIRIPYLGDQNVQNALGAIAIALLLQIPFDTAVEALAQFRGVKRRQEIIGEAVGITIVDDYAHHPTEIRTALSALRQRFPNRRLVVVYQPHLYSRTRDQLHGLIDSLATADFVVVTDIYPAREQPIPGVSAALIADGLLERESPPTLYVPIKEQIPQRLLPRLRPNDVVVVMGAGDIEKIEPVLLRRLEAQGQARRLTVAVLMGGDSPERDVSLLSGLRVMQALDPEKYYAVAVDPALLKGGGEFWGLQELLTRERPDVAFIALHGKHGEDGAVQGLLELLGIPYTGSGVLPSALAMNKHAAKIVFREAGLATPEGLLVSDCEEDTLERIRRRLHLPLVVKPNQGGSTLGTTRVFDWSELPRALRKALAYDESVLVEEFIEGVEVSIPVLGRREPQALPPVEIVPKRGYYDFQAKYVPGATEEIVPARLPNEMLHLLQETAIAAHLALGCRGMSRVDVIVHETTPYVLEVNTIPGLTPTSLLPRSAEAAGISFAELVERILQDTLDDL